MATNRREMNEIAKAYKAFQLRRAGAEYAEIGKAIGVRETTAYRLVQERLRQMRTETAEDLTAVRQIEIARCNQLFLSMYQRATEHKDPAAARVCLQAQQRLAALLGLDEPARLNVTMTEGRDLDAEIRAAEEKAAERAAKRETVQ